MQFTPSELTEKLLRTLDRDYNVVDLLGVQEVISILEKYPITRESLEETRVGKYVNEMRKKASDVSLKKRAKNLVRKWQTLITPPAAPPIPTAINGEGIGGIPHRLQGGPAPISPITRSSTPSSLKSNNNSPNLPVIDKNSRSSTPSHLQHQPCLSPLVSGSIIRPGTPDLNSGPNTPGFKPDSPAICTSTPCPPASQKIPKVDSSSSQTLLKTNAANRRKRRAESPESEIPAKIVKGSNVVSKNGQDSGKSKLVVNGMVGHDHNGESKYHSTSQLSNCGSTPVGRTMSGSLLSRRRQDTMSVKLAQEDPYKFEGSSPTMPPYQSERCKSSRTPKVTPKVKTTAQLIKDMASSGNLKVQGSKTAAKITLNQIEKEEDTPVSIVPAGAKPRPRRKPGSTIAPPSTSDNELHKTKNERVHMFLTTSVTPPPLTPTSSYHDLSHTLVTSAEPADVTLDKTDRDVTVAESGSNSLHSDNSALKCDADDSKREHLSLVGKDNVASTSGAAGDNQTVPGVKPEVKYIDPWSLLPPLDVDSIDWSEPEYPNTEPIEVTDDVVNRLNTEHWSHMNGNYDFQNEWHNWTQTLSVPSYNGDLLHILPYVDVDD